MYHEMHIVKLIVEERVSILHREAEEARLLRAANSSNIARKFQLPLTLAHLKEKIAAGNILNLFRQPVRFVKVE